MRVQRLSLTLKRRAYLLRFLFRRLNYSKRSLPQILILGAQKAGTTSLFRYLGQHPQLHPAVRKEVHFFDDGVPPGRNTYSLGLAWYRAHFPTRRRLGQHACCFEASPLYLFHPLAAERIAKDLPAARLIVLLRDPVERAVSHYHHQVQRNREPLDFDSALEAEAGRLAPSLAEQAFNSDSFRGFSYRSRGLYFQQLQRFEGFKEDGRLLVVHSDDLFQRPDVVLRQIFGFLEVNVHFEIFNKRPRNTKRIEDQVSEESRAKLRRDFTEPNRRLFEYLGRDFGWNA